MHRSSVVLCLSKPSTSIYLDFCPRDQCFKVAYIVEDCNYTVNPKCRSLLEAGGDEIQEVASVALEEITDPKHELLLGRDVISEEEACGTLLRASRETLTKLIEDHNTANPLSGLDMNLEEDGTTFRGFIRVHMNLCRPISIVSGNASIKCANRASASSSYDNTLLKTLDNSQENKLTSFYLPRDTVKALHVTSETTTHEVIAAILLKFKVVDNPKKFALYERYLEEGDTVKVKMRRIGETEKPLALALRWSHEQESNKMFVLQENETGDILWEAFSLPELGNFLRILDREEEEYKRLVRQKYQSLGKRIQAAMDIIQPPQPSSQSSPLTQPDS